jgi:hypothetical protein
MKRIPHGAWRGGAGHERCSDSQTGEEDDARCGALRVRFRADPYTQEK